MKKDKQAFKEEINRVLENVVQKHGASIVNHVRPVVETNIEKGRLEHFLEGNPSKTTNDYVWWVTDEYLQWHDYLYNIQQERSAVVWELLWEKIEQWSYHFLLRKGFYPGVETQKLAQEYGSEAVVAILQAHFPYDTELDAWLQQIVIYTCCNQIEVWKRQQALEKKLAQTFLDERLLTVSRRGMEHHISSQEQANILYHAIRQLKNAKMQQVLWLRYYGEFSSQEIAEIIGSSYRYVDKLHWKAKLLLGKILAGQGYSYG